MDVKKSPIAVLGAGAWGTALAILLAKNNQVVHLWDIDTNMLELMQLERMHSSRLPGIHFPEKLVVKTDLADAVCDVQDICLVVPSFAFEALLKQLKPLVRDDVRFVWGTKGLNPENAGLLSELIEHIFSKETPKAVLSGPSFAREVAIDTPTAVSLASDNEALTQSLIDRLCNGAFNVYETPDLIGVQLCGVVKNVLAIATGISDGMGFGANTRCAIISRGLQELSSLCVALGGQPETPLSLAGVGDLVLTCTDDQSRNRQFGLALGRGISGDAALAEIGQSVEGYYNAKQLHELALKYQVEMPIVAEVYAVLYEYRSPRAILHALLGRGEVVTP